MSKWDTIEEAMKDIKNEMIQCDVCGKKIKQTSMIKSIRVTEAVSNLSKQFKFPDNWRKEWVADFKCHERCVNKVIDALQKIERQGGKGDNKKG